MVLTLIPMSSFAASGDIKVLNKRTNTALNGGFTQNDANPPTLSFDNAVDNGVQPLDSMTTGRTFTIKLSGNVMIPNEIGGVDDYYGETGADWLVLAGGNTVERTGPQTLLVTVNDNTVARIDVPLYFKTTSTGTVTAFVERLVWSGDVNEKGYLVTNVVRSSTTAIVDTVGNIARNNNIVESSSSEARLRLVEVTPDAWNGAETIELRIDNSDYTYGPLAMTVDGFNVPAGGPTNATTDDNWSVVDARTLVINLANIAINEGLTNTETDEIIIDMPIRVGRDAKVGTEVSASFRGDVSPSKVVLAKYTDYAVELKAEKVLDVVAGQDVPGRYEAIVTLEEMVAGSLLDGRVLDVSLVGVDKDGKDVEEVAAFQMDEMIRFTQLKGDAVGLTRLSLDTTHNDKYAVIAANRQSMTIDNPDGTDLFEVEVTRGSNFPNTPDAVASKWEIEVPFVASTDYAGELFLKFNNAGLTNQKVKIADVKAPVTVEIGQEGEKLADLNIGQQNQPAPDITIKETVAGALLELDVVRSLDNEYGIMTPSSGRDNMALGGVYGGTRFTKGETSIKEGDASIDEDGRVFTLDEVSTKPATFLISGIAVTLDRTVPYGEYKIGIDAGNVAARHDILTDRLDSYSYFNVVTPHPEDKNVLTVFTIGQASYKQTISGVEKEMAMEVAPQIMNNRTMMPIRYVADALGAKVNYDVATRTAIFSKDAMVVSMTLDTNIMYVNGSPVVMDTAPVVQNSRALVSLVNVAQAFGLNSVSAPATGDIVWDSAANTVTLFPSAQ